MIYMCSLANDYWQRWGENPRSYTRERVIPADYIPSGYFMSLRNCYFIHLENLFIELSSEAFLGSSKPDDLQGRTHVLPLLSPLPKRNDATQICHAFESHGLNCKQYGMSFVQTFSLIMKVNVLSFQRLKRKLRMCQKKKNDTV